MNESLRIHKIGTITLGIVLILFGILFLVHIFMPIFSLSFVFKLWPAIFIILGLEILCSHFRHDFNITYDFAAVALLFFLMVFAAGMGVLEWMIEHVPDYVSWY